MNFSCLTLADKGCFSPSILKDREKVEDENLNKEYFKKADLGIKWRVV